MVETTEEQISRVEEMATGHGGTWDLSPNDIAALKTVTAMLKDLATGIMYSEQWNDDWCPVCCEHPSHGHGGENCPMVVLAGYYE